jgi:16S rRNA A1518/A1519 N6-dimethyltransferase RsmA/KsgA/DIM1 with predicted DNA glycosylase/AP lyase activity
MTTIRSLKEIENVWGKKYDELLDFVLKDIQKKSIKSILELGSGKGQMTVSLIKKI